MAYLPPTLLNGGIRSHGLHCSRVYFFPHSAPPYNQERNSRRYLDFGLRTPPPHPLDVLYFPLLVHSRLPHVPTCSSHCPIHTLFPPPTAILHPFSSPEVHQFLLQNSLRTLQRDICRHAKKQLRSSLPDLIPSLPPDAVTTSLLSPITSFPLASAPQSDSDFHLPNPTYRLAFSRKLRLPLFTTTTVDTSTCPCGARLDIYGDHFFSCVRHSKTFFSNSLRNALWAVCHCTTTLANITDSIHDVFLEPQHLSPTFPSSRPADVGLRLSPSYLADHTISRPLAFLAIDVSVTSVPPVLADLNKNAVSALQTHVAAEAKKLPAEIPKTLLGKS